MKNNLETRLGIFFALALVVAVLILEMIGAADFFKGGYNITGSFRNAQDLKRGDLVKTAGVEIGRVEKIELENGRAKVTMKIQKRFEIKTDARAAIGAILGKALRPLAAGQELVPVLVALQ